MSTLEFNLTYQFIGINAYFVRGFLVARKCEIRKLIPSLFLYLYLTALLSMISTFFAMSNITEKSIIVSLLDFKTNMKLGGLFHR